MQKKRDVREEKIWTRRQKIEPGGNLDHGPNDWKRLQLLASFASRAFSLYFRKPTDPKNLRAPPPRTVIPHNASSETISAHLLSRARRRVYKFLRDGLAKVAAGIYVVHAPI